MYVLRKCQAHLPEILFLVYKGLSSSQHTIAAREHFDYHYSSPDTGYAR